MKLKIISDEGAIQGWFVSLVFTTLTMILLILSFLFTSVADNWIKISSTYIDVYKWSLTTWFGYKVIKHVADVKYGEKPESF